MPMSASLPSMKVASSSRKRDKPPVLDISVHSEETDERGVFPEQVSGQDSKLPSPNQLEIVVDTDQDYNPLRRSVSATSSLDPYYFGLSPSDSSPIPPLPTHDSHDFIGTPEIEQSRETPITPARDPASIDRRGLYGLGELATPRWTQRGGPNDAVDNLASVPETPQIPEEYQNQDVLVPNERTDNDEDDIPDSPWTIEAVDGETSEKDQPSSPPRPLRSRRSVADESGGEEILYPRKTSSMMTVPELSKPPVPRLPAHSHASTMVAEDDQQQPLSTLQPSPNIPPSSYPPQIRRAKKRTSDEFEMDNTGTLMPKRSSSNPSSTSPGTKDKSKDIASRKHRSLGATTGLSPREARKDKRRESTGLTISSGVKAAASPRERHTRQSSIGSSSSSAQTTEPPRARVHNTDFSHLPPSPSSSSIQQFLRTTSNGSAPLTPPLNASKDLAHSPSVAHSLLRGTQEGWSGMDDEATAEALRKLDGLSGKSARVRSSVGSLGARGGSQSRSGTPPNKAGSHNQWEGMEPPKSVRRTSSNSHKDVPVVGLGLTIEGRSENTDQMASAISSDEHGSSSAPEKTPKKTGSASARSSLAAKRGSASSTNYTSTPSSRDSASISVGTSATSVSATSGRHSIGGKTRRNSASSDISSVHSSDATSLKDRVASLALNHSHAGSGGEGPEEEVVPPVPPLPKDLSTYRSPPSTAVNSSFPASSGAPAEEIVRSSHENTVNSDVDRTISLEITSPPPSDHSHSNRRQSQHYTAVGYTSMNSDSASSPVTKTPSKKWSFSNALNLKLSHSPSTSSLNKANNPVSPRSVSFGQQLRKSLSREHTQGLSPSTASTSGQWSPVHSEAMQSAASLASLSSVGSIRTPALPSSKTPDRTSSRPGTGDSSGVYNNASTYSGPGLSSLSTGPLSPSTSVRRGQTKRLTPSSIPFFRRSSSQSMQVPVVAGSAASSSPTLSSTASHQSKRRGSSPDDNMASTSTSVPTSAHRKSSVLSLGLPSLLKSSSRKSLHGDSKEATRDLQRAKDAVKDAEKDRLKTEKERIKKEERDRSESRISVLMGRKRGKTLSSTEPRKPRSPVNSMPPMQISAIEPATAQRVARLKTSNHLSSSSTSTTSSSRSTSASRLTSQTVSSMQKQSDSSLRSTRNQLPTIAGSPSVGANIAQPVRELKEGNGPPSTLLNTIGGHSKETPTKIPRISSRSSAVTASPPPPKGLVSTVTARRVSGLTTSRNGSPSMNEFGVMENENQDSSVTPATARGKSPPASAPRVVRQISTSTTSTSILPRKSNRDSISFSGLRKSSTGSVTSVSNSALSPPEAPVSQHHHHRFSGLSPSKGLKLLSPKISLSATRSSHSTSQTIHQAMTSPSSSRQSLSTPSPVPSSQDDEEIQGDEEMLAYIRRQQAKKIASGATQEQLDEALHFPEPITPTPPLSPSALLNTSQAQYLSEYERKEVLDFPNVYYIGAKSKKKMATLDSPTNNYGYDDDRGDYLVVNHDHLSYRYEVIDTLGKGSFGQVLHCRDHCTGESVAIKIIRNKKRFHHQALVEIKILDNLRKWDADEKHHVIKMTEHFHFRNHLCIAMELLSINLYELIKANGFVGFTTALIRRFTSQMLMSLSLMRHHRIVHCDLKPENVLLSHPAKSGIKVIDFGSSCFEHEKVYTYIQSRFYRSPEVILGMNYHMAIDMWSLGCILAELYTGFPIFPGENEQEQLACIMEVLGPPDKEHIAKSSRKKFFFDPNGQPRPVVNSKGRRRRPGTKTLAQVLRCNDEDFVDFIAKCLVWDPERRIKPQAALRHPFITGRRFKVPASTSKSTLTSSSLSGSRRKEVTETPKKSLISAPTPLTARTSRITNNGVPSTPNSSTHSSTTLGSSSRSYRVSQPQSLSSYHSSRTLNGYATTAK